MEFVIVAGIFICTVLLIEGAYYAIQSARKPELVKVRRRLRTLAAGGYKDNEDINILRTKVLSEVPWFNRVLLRTPDVLNLHKLIDQANARFPLGFYLSLSILFAALGFLGGAYLTHRVPIRVLLTVLLGLAPYIYLVLKKQARLQKFERQLPDALDLVARALKAGHAFSGGLKMVADEFDDPVGTEFDRTLDEINFGIGIPEAMKNLTDRVDCPDLKFFVVAVLIQRETGGNLAEILENIAKLIRARFELQGRIRVLSAEGRLSAIILIAIPFCIGAYFYLVKPGWLNPLLVDPVGKVMIVGAAILIVLGVLVMKKMVQIKV